MNELDIGKIQTLKRMIDHAKEKKSSLGGRIEGYLSELKDLGVTVEDAQKQSDELQQEIEQLSNEFNIALKEIEEEYEFT